ncbi:MAG: damage-inducible protein DinB [Bacteroidetes bacterium]|nr:MAG: damage-inducible protein DinB [Bacteroidota bacterium]
MVSKKEAIAAEFYWNYINQVKENDVVKALKKNTSDFKKFLKKIPSKKIDYAYGEGKWTIKEVLQHMIDSERVFAYRALRFARMDTTPLPGFDEKQWTANAHIKNRKWDDLVKEFKSIRKGTEVLFASFDQDQLLSGGVANNKNINTLAIGYICSGHVAHHMKIIKERYL